MTLDQLIEILPTIRTGGGGSFPVVVGSGPGAAWYATDDEVVVGNAAGRGGLDQYAWIGGAEQAPV